MSKLSECEKYPGRLCDICNGVDGLDPAYVAWWREQNGLAPIGQDQEAWNVTMKSRGLGDDVAKFTHNTGISAVAHAFTAVTGIPCGCGARQELLNQIKPYQG